MDEKNLITEDVVKHYTEMADEYFREIPHKEFLLGKPFAAY